MDETTGNYAQDCFLGADYAVAYVEAIIEHDRGCVTLAWIAADMGLADEDAMGIAIGFWSTLAEFIHAGGHSMTITGYRKAIQQRRDRWTALEAAEAEKRQQHARRAARARWAKAREREAA